MNKYFTIFHPKNKPSAVKARTFTHNSINSFLEKLQENYVVLTLTRKADNKTWFGPNIEEVS